MKINKYLLIPLILLFSASANAIIIDYVVSGTVSTLSGTSGVNGLAEGDQVFAAWTLDTQNTTSQSIVSTISSSESGLPVVSSFAINGGISNFSLRTTTTLLNTSTPSSSSDLLIGENGAPSTDTSSTHDSSMSINNLSDNGYFSLLNLAGTCCGKSILLSDINNKSDLAAYLLSDFNFGFGLFAFTNTTVNWVAEYQSINATIRSSTIPLPPTLPLIIIGLPLLYWTGSKKNKY